MATQVNNKWRIAAIVLFLFALAQGLELYQLKSKLKNVFYYGVTLTFKDKITGQILESVATCYPNSPTFDPFQHFVRHEGTLATTKISGIYYQPREFGFIKNGYKQKNVIFSKDTNWNLTVELEPMDANAGQASAGQPATTSESKSEDGDKPKPVSEPSPW
jgi:hypothetical protein